MNAATLSLRVTLIALVLGLFSAAPALAKSPDEFAQRSIAQMMHVTNKVSRIARAQTAAGIQRLAQADEKGAPDALLVRLAANSNHSVTKVSMRGAHLVHAIGMKTSMRLQQAGADPALIAMVQQVQMQALETIRGNAEMAHDAIAAALEEALATDSAETPAV